MPGRYPVRICRPCGKNCRGDEDFVPGDDARDSTASLVSANFDML